MITALLALSEWAPILALAIIGVLALVGAVICVVLIKKTKKEMKSAEAEVTAEDVAEQPVAEENITEQPLAEEPVVEEVAEEVPAPAAEPAEQPVAEEAADGYAEPETALYEQPIAEEVAVEEVQEEVIGETAEEPAPVEEIAEETVEEVIEEPAVVEEAVEEVAEETVEEVVEEPVPAPVVEEVAEEVPAEEPVVEETVEEEIIPEPVEEPAPAVQEAEKPAPIIVRRLAPEGKVFVKIRYNRSYTAKIIQANDTVKDYYTEIKNELMRYGVHSRTSWKYETFRRGRKLLVKLAVRGKSLYVYFALNPADYADTKYKVNDVSHVASNAAVPTLYKIKNDRRCRYAKQLIADVMAANGLEAGAEQSENYAAQYPYEEVEPLVERGLIKLLKWEEAASGSEVGVIAIPVEELPANAVEADEDEIAAANAAEEIDDDFDEDEVEEVVEELPAEEPVEEETVEEVPAEEPVEEEEIIPEPVPEPEEPVGVTVAEAEEKISDEEVENYVLVSHKYSDKSKKAIVNIDTLGRYFSAGETVTVEEIRKRVPEIGSKVTYIKVLARGRLDKALNVEADDFSPAAIKMIVLMGGQVIRKSTNIN